MRIFYLFLVFLFFAVPEPQPVWGAFKSMLVPDNEPEMPKAEREDDITLPLPYSGVMIFRPVFVSSNELIRDRTFPMGINNLENQDRQIFERQFMGHISAPFTSEDLPSGWKLKKDRKGSWYFIGKYEVTRSQWNQVMKGLLPDGEKNPEYDRQRVMDPALPVADVSWVEVQEFIKRYNNWLIRNHPDKLPRFRDTKNVGFLRLPTEAEWEFAARGGENVPREWLEQEDFHPMPNGRGYAHYAIYTEPRIMDKPLSVGSRFPNPLEIYDTAGNVREMVDGLFHMSIADMVDDRVVRRLHGGAGGLITKGGSFSSDKNGILPGAREELPLYSVDGAVGARDLGFRLVIGGANLQGGQRLEELKKESSSLPSTVNPNNNEELGENLTPQEMVAALQARASGKLRDDLARLGARLDDQANAEKSRALKNLENTYRSLLYQAETLRAFAYRYVAANKEYVKLKGLLSKNMDKDTRADVEELLTRAKKDMDDYFQSLEMGASYYKSNLGTIYAQPADELKRLAQQSRSEYGGKGIFNEHMLHNIDILEEYLKTVREKGLKALMPATILKGILPASHFSVLPLKGKG